MKLTHLNLGELKLSTINVRKKGGKDVSDLVPSIRSLGIVQPLLVRPNCEGFEIVAGQRRYRALQVLAEEGITDAVPCAIMEDGDDAKAIEASLAENVARLPMDEIDQYKAFAALVAKGETADDIASRFGVTTRLVNQRLAIANIIEPILNLYRREEIGAQTLRVMTMATKRQQQAWWKLYKSDEDYAPQGHALKEWLFGGSQIPVSNALFDVAEYTGTIVSDLFGEERYFADAEAFWALQNKAIAEKQEAYLGDGWSEVVVLDIGRFFSTWEHTKVVKKKGGKVFVAITNDGEATFHEGWLSTKEARRKEKAEANEGEGREVETKPAKPELTSKMRNYVGLHKHAAVRTELLAHPGIALRLAVAHAIAGSGLWSVRADDQRAEGEAIATSLALSKAQAGFAEERRRIRLLLGIGDDQDADDAEAIVPRKRDWQSNRDLAGIFESLIHMEDNTVLRILTYLMAETLEAHSGVVEGLGMLLSTDMKNWWQPDETFFDLLRDKSAINAMLREVAGDVTADAHTASTAKVQKKIIADCLTGNDREKVEGWLPRYMAFPEGSYVGRADRKTGTDPDADDDVAEPDAEGESAEDDAVYTEAV
ncbi:MAG: ParB/RepB/Spo0J family partition protein [Rhizobiaceae bacterium]